MKDYFECNLPLRMTHFDPAGNMDELYSKAREAIAARTKKLNEALDYSGMKGEDFQPLAAELFRNHPSRFEAMTAMELASYVSSIYDGASAEPRMDWPNAVVLFDTAFTTNDEWVSIRHIGLGGSNTEVLGYSNFKIPRETFYEKRGVPLPSPKKASQIPLVRGHFCEDFVINNFCSLTGAVRIPETRMFASKKYPHCIADMDAIVRTVTGDLLIFEAKTTVCTNESEWIGYKTEKVPGHYVSQCHHYAGVLDDSRIKGTVISCMFVQDYSADEAFFGVAERGTNATRFIDRDEAAEDNVLASKEDFWETYIATGTVPPDSGNAKMELSLLNQLKLRSSMVPPVEFTDADTLAMFEDYISVNEEYEKLKREADGQDAVREQIKRSLIARLGTATCGYATVSDGNVRVIKYAPTKDSEVVNLEMLKAAFPQAYETCVSTAPGASRFTFSKPKSQNTWAKDLLKYGVSQ